MLKELLLRKGKLKKKVSVIKMLFDNPDEFIFIGEVVDGELVVRAKKKERKIDE